MKDLSKFTKIDLEYLSTPPIIDGFYQVITKHYWIVTPDHEVLLYRGGAPQCNADRRVAESFLKGFGPGFTIQYVTCAFIPHECEPEFTPYRD